MEDEEASASEEGEPEWEPERTFGYDPDMEDNIWEEYQAIMEDHRFAY